MKHLILSTALVAVVATPAFGQIPSPTASYAAQTLITSPEGRYAANVYGAPMKSRMDAYIQGQAMTTVIDMNTQTSLSFSTDPNSPMGKTAMKMDYGKVAARYGAVLEPQGVSNIVGTDSVAGHSCTLYQQDDVTGCITSDGIPLRVRGAEGYGMEVQSLTRGPQPDYYFQAPADYTVTDMTDLGSALGSMVSAGSYGDGYGNPAPQDEAGGGEVESFIANQAERQAKRAVRNEIRDQAGSSLGGVIGGGIAGELVGNEAGKLIGGLFGNKKKKKKKKDEEAALPE